MCATASSLPQNGHEAPEAERGGIDHRADPVARLPMRGLFGVSTAVRRWYLRIWNARTVPMPTSSTAHGQSSTLPVFSAVMTAATAAQTEPNEHRPGILEQRIDQRRVNRRRHLPDRFAFFDRPAASAAHASCSGCVLLPVRR